MKGLSLRRKTLVALLVAASAVANAQPVAAKESRAAPTVSGLRAEEVSGIGEIRLSAVIDSGGLKTSWRIAVEGFVLCEGPFRVEKRPPKEPLRVAKGSIDKNVTQAEVSGTTAIGEHVATSFEVVARNAAGEAELGSGIPLPPCPAE